MRAGGNRSHRSVWRQNAVDVQVGRRCDGRLRRAALVAGQFAIAGDGTGVGQGLRRVRNNGERHNGDRLTRRVNPHGEIEPKVETVPATASADSGSV